MLTHRAIKLPWNGNGCQGKQPGPQTLNHSDKPTLPAEFIEHGMELLIEVDIALDLLLRGRLSHVLLDTLQFLEITFSQVLYSLARSIGFQQHTKPVNFLHVFAAKHTHDVTAAFICGDQSVCFESL